MLFVLRHGERCDLVNDPVENARVTVESDSPITRKGWVMGERTGAKIRELAGDVPIRLVASPFARCLETAQAVATQFSGIQKILVNYRCGEFLNGQWFTADPQQTLMIRNSPEFQAAMRVPLEFLPNPETRFPETIEEMSERYINDVKSAIIDWVLQGETVVIVSHGYYGDRLISLFKETNATGDFCSLTVARRKDDWVELVMEIDTQHVADLLTGPIKYSA